MKFRWVSLIPPILLACFLASIDAPLASYYMYGVCIIFLFTGIYLQRTMLIYLAGVMGSFSYIPITTVRDDWMPVVCYSFFVLLMIELAVESVPPGYISIRWKRASMRNWLLAEHIAFLGTVIVISILLYQFFNFLMLRTNDILLLLVITVLCMGGLAFFIRIYARTIEET